MSIPSACTRSDDGDAEAGAPLSFPLAVSSAKSSGTSPNSTRRDVGSWLGETTAVVCAVVVRVDSGAVVLSAKASRLRRSTRAARSSPPRRDGAYWHCLATSRHRLHCGRVASHLRCRERHGRQAREERVAPRACGVVVLLPSFMGVERHSVRLGMRQGVEGGPSWNLGVSDGDPEPAG